LLGAGHLSIILLGISFGCQEVSHGPGVLAPDSPIQNNVEDAEQIIFKDYLIKPLAEFSIKARVLSVKRYSSDLSPVDLALGWGSMSDESIINNISITQSNRWYHWYCEEFPIPRREIETNSANIHLIPAIPEITDQIKQVRKGNIVELHGYLVDVKGPDGLRWKSSLTREDTGDHSCELIWVESISLIQ